MNANGAEIPESESRMSHKELLAAVCDREDGGYLYFNLHRGYERLGYALLSLPFPSTYDGFCAEARAALEELERKAEQVRKDFGHRRMSRPHLARLHQQAPEPFFGVRVI